MLGYGVSTTLVFDLGVYLSVIGLVVAAFALLGGDEAEEESDEHGPVDDGAPPGVLPAPPGAPVTAVAPTTTITTTREGASR